MTAVVVVAMTVTVVMVVVAVALFQQVKRPVRFSVCHATIFKGHPQMSSHVPKAPLPSKPVNYR
ncbi:hypothetical protein E2C01_053517 [Portunus trituberculatus]|uniref:Uncharacterized protein n=1 Tax=Portunus trituberculatus TaxID=210409 RepID=A0A5B7GQI7_PORTR|nr:hypothetical protein [Portunus trituberculatus]